MKNYQKCKWKEARTFTDEEYFYSRIDFLSLGTQMLIRFKSKRKAKYLKIDNYKELTALQVIMELNGYLLGRHFEDGVKTVWREEGLKLGSMKGELKNADTESIRPING